MLCNTARSVKCVNCQAELRNTFYNRICVATELIGTDVNTKSMSDKGRVLGTRTALDKRAVENI